MTKIPPVIDDALEGYPESKVVARMRYERRVYEARCDSALLVSTDEGGPVAVSMMGNEDHIPYLAGCALRLALDHERLTATLGVVMQHNARELVLCFAEAVLYTLTKGGTDGEAEGGPGPDAGGEAGDGPGGARAGDDPEEAPEEGGV